MNRFPIKYVGFRYFEPKLGLFQAGKGAGTFFRVGAFNRTFTVTTILFVSGKMVLS